MTSKKKFGEKDFMELLERVLPKATGDRILANRIFDAVIQEITQVKSAEAFAEFCESFSVPDTEEPTLKEAQVQCDTLFGPGVVELAREEDNDQAVRIEMKMEGQTLASEIRVGPPAEEDEDPLADLDFVPFPVCLPEDPEMVWLLAKRENLTNDEAGVALASAEEEFWNTKAGLKCLKKGVPRTFHEFIGRVPSKALTERGVKRHYKEPQPLKQVRRLAQMMEERGGGGPTPLDRMRAEIQARKTAAVAESSVPLADSPQTGADDEAPPWDTVEINENLSTPGAISLPETTPLADEPETDKAAPENSPERAECF